MYVLDVPSEKSVEQSVKDHHQSDKLQTELIVFNWRHRDVVPLNTDAFDLIERKVFSTETKRRRRQHRLHHTMTPRFTM